MNYASQKLADSLEQLQLLQEKGVIAIQSKQLSRQNRERLVKHGYIREVIRGWYISARPDETPGDSTSWFISYWGFNAAYLTERFGGNWCLSPEHSINLHIGDKVIPQQLFVRSPKGSNKPTAFPHNTSVFDVRLKVPDTDDIVSIGGLNVYSLASALVNSSAHQFIAAPVQMRTALSMVTDASDILSVLIKGGHSVIAGRLIGAFRNIGRGLIADNIRKGMQAADFKVQEVDPFTLKTAINFGRRDVSPNINRLRLIWAHMRKDIMDCFPEPSEPLDNIETYLVDIDDKYVTDAYHSLSIEGYRVTRPLIDIVRSGEWQTYLSDNDNRYLDVVAARGYWEIFQEARQAIRSVLEGANPGEILEKKHGDWYSALFSSSVESGCTKQAKLDGYRTASVHIRQSRYTPPGRDVVDEMMDAYFRLLAEEENAAVRVVLGHFLFVYIHPYVDGNGRIGRLIMNLMLASGGYPWLIVPVERVAEYMEALETASNEQDIVPFTKFLASLM